jgi:hypothetical protein
MSELQDQFDKGEINPEEYHARWDEQMAENERLHPGIHDRLYEYLMAKCPAPVLMLMNFLLENNWAESPTPLTRHLRSYT